MEPSRANNSQMFHIRPPIDRQDHPFLRRRVRTPRRHEPHRLGVLVARCDLLSWLYDLGMAHLRALAKATSCEVPGRISKYIILRSQAAIN